MKGHEGTHEGTHDPEDWLHHVPSKNLDIDMMVGGLMAHKIHG